MAKNILITTIYKGNATAIALRELEKQGIDIDSIYFIRSKSSDNASDEAVEMVKRLYEVDDISVEEVLQYDLKAITETVGDAIEAEEENTIYVHVTEGRKTMSLGSLFAAYANSSSIQKIFYVTTEGSELVQIPKIPMQLSDKKRRVLELLKRDRSVKEIKVDMEISESTVYNHIKELRESGYVDSEKHLTPVAEYLLKA